MSNHARDDISIQQTHILPAVRPKHERDYGVLLNIVLLAAWGVVIELLIIGAMKVTFP